MRFLVISERVRGRWTTSMAQSWRLTRKHLTREGAPSNRGGLCNWPPLAADVCDPLRQAGRDRHVLNLAGNVECTVQWLNSFQIR